MPTKTPYRLGFSSLSPTVIIGFLLVCLVLAYSAYVAFPLISGPRLTAVVLEQEQGSFLIHGTAQRVSEVFVNDLPIALTDQGMFAVERTYPPGYTVVIVRAKDRFGRVREQTLTFVNSHYIQYASKEISTEDSSESNEDAGDERGQTSIN